MHGYVIKRIVIVYGHIEDYISGIKCVISGTSAAMAKAGANGVRFYIVAWNFISVYMILIKSIRYGNSSK